MLFIVGGTFLIQFYLHEIQKQTTNAIKKSENFQNREFCNVRFHFIFFNLGQRTTFKLKYNIILYENETNWRENNNKKINLKKK